MASRSDLIIVGGAEILHRHAILRRFVELAGSRGKSRFGVLASATARPEAEFRKLQQCFSEVGVEPERLFLLAVSRFVPGWAGGARDPAQIALVESLQGLWFLGGDQNLTMDLLLEHDGSDTLLLAAIRRRAARPNSEGGLLLGGSSAGAAVLSDPMIGAGDSFGALALPRASGPGIAEMGRALWVRSGLGFFDEGMIDQHFDKRARLGRLVEAALVEDGARRLAFGIGEATALVREGATGRLTVVGAGGVMVVDVRRASRDLVETRDGPRRRIRGVILHYLTEGDSFFPRSETFDFGLKVAVEAGDATFASERPEASGLLSPYGCLADFAARMLLDNDPSLLFSDEEHEGCYVRSFLVEEVPGASGRIRSLGWEIRLRRDSGGIPSRLFYDGHYSWKDVGLDIIPIEFEITRPFS